MNKILIAGIMILIAIVMVATFFFLSAVTDPTPPQVRAGWYLPQQDIVWTTTGPSSTHPTQEHLVLAGHRDAAASQFPTLSPYGRYENYTHLTTNNQYMIAVWYFNDERKFLESQKILIAFLENEGEISSVDLNFTEHSKRFRESAPGEDSQNRYTIPDHLKATGYESASTSGCFFTVTIPEPGYYAENKEYYIVYYGTTSPANLTSQIPFLQEMIAETYRYDLKSTAGALL